MKKLYLIIFAILFSFASNAQVGPITGTLSVCATYQVTLSCTPAGGTWSSTNPLVASIGSGTGAGVVTGVSAGVVTITYNAGSIGFATASFTVNPLPATITCPTSGCNVCLGDSITVTDPTPGGIWSTQNPTIATVGSASGVVVGVSLGTTVLSYALVPTGCFVTSLITVNPLPLAFTVTGGGSYCSGGAGVPVGLSGSQTGVNYQLMCSGSPVGSSVAGTGAALTFGLQTAPCVYTVVATNSFGCRTTMGSVTVVVNPTPGPISCPTSSGCKVCVGSTITLTCPPTGGIWSSSNPAIGSVDPLTGVVTGISPGSITITYTLGPCSTSTTIIVNPNPSAITGITTICAGSTTTLSCTPPLGSIGTWSSSTPAVGTVSGTGVVTGISAGVTTITYMLGTGCYSVINVTVNPMPGPISCPSTSGCAVCVGNTILLTNSVTGGVWTSSNTSVATVGSSSGIVTGISPGTVTITYTLPGGCFVTVTILVNPNPLPITGTTTVCVGATTTLSCGTPGGTWSSSAPGIATVSGTGVVTGVSAGTATITYMLGTGCYSTTTVTVNPVPTILGSGGTTSFHVCVGSTITLNATPTGGVWTSSPVAIATIGSSSGIVTGITPGVATIVYTLPGGCFTTTTVTVDPNPGPITGTTIVCVGNTTTLACLPSGGIWSSSPVTIATVGSLTGVVTGVSAGVATITYTLSTGCFVITSVTVNPVPTITGAPFTCVGATTTLIGTPSGGIWSSGNPSVGTVGAGTGIVTGITPGTTPITYTLPTGCSVTIIVTVTPAPGPIYCPSMGCQVCVGSSVLLTNPIPGGVWSSSNTVIATVGSNTGVVTGVSVGTSYITYTLGGCFVVTLFTVNPVPIAYTVTGGGSYCAGGSGVLVGLSNSQIGVNYQLFCGGSPVGSPVAGTGSAISFGLQTSPCTYTVVATNAFGCSTNMTGSVVVTINPMPLPIVCPISGCQVCAGTSILLTDPTPGGVWSGSNPAIATVGSGTGVVTGVAAGVVVITYMLPGGCYVTTTFTVNPSPAAITGPHSVCVGNTILLSDATTGGTWSTSCGNVSVNSASGVVTGIAAGPCNSITYTLPGGCYTTYTVTVNPVPCNVGVNEINATAGKVEVFPNPAFNELTIKMEEGAYSSFTITNNIGQVLVTRKLNAKETTISVKELPSAIYYITLRGENGIIVRRFMKE